MALVYLGAVGLAFLITFLCTKLWRRLRQRHYKVPARDVSKGHRWCMMDLFTQPTYCNISEAHILSGAFCDCCGICVDDCYIKEANKKLKCKELSTKSEVQNHHWVKGNLPLCSTCSVCNEQCGTLPRLCDLRCLWCTRTIHEKCHHTVDNICDLGPYRACIIPPNCVRLKMVGIKGRRRYVVDSVRHPGAPDWTPLIVIANRRSGNGGDAEQVLQAFRQILNPAQVVDLAEISPEDGLEWCHLLPSTTCQVLVAGGDGTIGWVLQAIDKLKIKVESDNAESHRVLSRESSQDSDAYSTASSTFETQPLVELTKPTQVSIPAPQVCMLPLGTGNDLSRVLGWGDGYHGDVDVGMFLQQMRKARAVKLDRWSVEITPAKHFGFRFPKKNLIMNNYASIGVDALVTLNFHKHRELRPHIFSSRILNKFLYFTYGTKDVLERECKHLDKKLKVWLDDDLIELPNLEGLVLLNIGSWGGGCRPWQLGSSGKNMPARFDDGKMEVMGLYSSFHIAQLQVGLAEPVRLGQARTVKLKTVLVQGNAPSVSSKIQLHGGNAPMQVDGEPWEQHPATITLTHNNQATMLASTPEGSCAR